MDFSFEKNVGAILHMYLGGQAVGESVADLISGEVNPSGKLADTFAARLEDYPSTENFHESVEYVDYTEDRLVSVLVRILTRFYVRR